MIDLSNSAQILDVVGGSGWLAIGLCESIQHVNVTIVDLPEIVSITKMLLSERRISARIRIIDADIVRSTPEGRYDVAVLRSFIQI
jgi:methylase of polypeptide subunit release factors